MPLVPTLASNGRTLLRARPLAALQRAIELGVARDPERREAATVLLRPLQLLDGLWSEVDGVFHNHPPAIDRMRLELAAAAGWQHWLTRLLLDGSPLEATANAKVELDPLGIVDMGALAILCQAVLRVAVTADPDVLLETPLSLALSAAPAEALARVTRDLHPETLPILLHGLELAHAPPLPATLQALLAAPEELARWRVIDSLRQVLRRWETTDRRRPATRWDAATADGITSVEVDGDHVLAHGLDLSEADSTVVLFASNHPQDPVRATPSEPVQVGDGVRAALPVGFRVGWIGRESPSLMAETNLYRETVRQRWQQLDELGLTDVPFELVDDIVTPAAPPRTRTNQVVVGPTVLWVHVRPTDPGPGDPVIVQWEALAATAVRIEHDGEVFDRGATGRLDLTAPPFGTRTVSIVPMSEQGAGPAEKRTYTVLVVPGVDAEPIQPRKVVVVRSKVLAQDKQTLERASTESLEKAARKARIEIEIVELPVVPDELAVLLERPRSGTRLLDALERLAVCSPGGADAWWLVWVPGQAGLLQTRTSSTVQGVAVADEASASDLMQHLAQALRPLAEEAPMLRVIGRVASDGVHVASVREELRQRPLGTPRQPPVKAEAASLEWITRNAMGDVLDSVPLSTRSGPFALLLPSSAEAVTLQLRGTVGGLGVLFERNRSRHRPRVEFVSWGTELETRYEHAGQLGARLYLELSRSGVWTGAAELDPCPGRTRVDRVELGPMDGARVVAVDGWNSAAGELDGDLPTPDGWGRIRQLPDGTLAADVDGDFRWRVDGRVGSAEPVFQPPPVGRVQLELGSALAPLTTLEWRSR